MDRGATRAAHARFARRLLDHARELEAAGDLDAATGALERLAAIDPLSEEAATAVIRAHALAGQRHLALRWYRQFEARLDEELGVEPGAEARRLHEEIAAGRFPAVAAEPAAAAGPAASAGPAGRAATEPWTGIPPPEDRGSRCTHTAGTNSPSGSPAPDTRTTQPETAAA